MTEKKPLKQAENLLESTRDLNQLMMENVEKLVKMNLELVESYSHIGLESYKAALGIRSIDELKEYAKKQREATQEIAGMISRDSNAVVRMINDHMMGAQKVAGSTLASLGAAPFMDIFGMLSKSTNALKILQGETGKTETKRGAPPEDVQ